MLSWPSSCILFAVGKVPSCMLSWYRHSLFESNRRSQHVTGRPFPVLRLCLYGEIRPGIQSPSRYTLIYSVRENAGKGSESSTPSLLGPLVAAAVLLRQQASVLLFHSVRHGSPDFVYADLQCVCTLVPGCEDRLGSLFLSPAPPQVYLQSHW